LDNNNFQGLKVHDFSDFCAIGVTSSHFSHLINLGVMDIISVIDQYYQGVICLYN